MTKSEARAARKAGTLRDYNDHGEPMRTPAEERRHARSMHRWARRYDRLNGAPEGDDDR
jgi:hypothetical protein